MDGAVPEPSVSPAFPYDGGPVGPHPATGTGGNAVPKLQATRKHHTTITTPATLPGAAPIRRCPSCGIGYVMAGDPPVLAWEGACNRCGEVVHDAAPTPPEPEGDGPLVTCVDCQAPFRRRTPRHVRCKPCGVRRNLEAARAWNRAHRARHAEIARASRARRKRGA